MGGRGAGGGGAGGGGAGGGGGEATGKAKEKAIKDLETLQKRHARNKEIGFNKYGKKYYDAVKKYGAGSKQSRMWKDKWASWSKKVQHPLVKRMNVLRVKAGRMTHGTYHFTF